MRRIRLGYFAVLRGDLGAHVRVDRFPQNRGRTSWSPRPPRVSSICGRRSSISRVCRPPSHGCAAPPWSARSRTSEISPLNHDMARSRVYLMASTTDDESCSSTTRRRRLPAPESLLGERARLLREARSSSSACSRRATHAQFAVGIVTARGCEAARATPSPRLRFSRARWARRSADTIGDHQHIASS